MQILRNKYYYLENPFFASSAPIEYFSDGGFVMDLLLNSGRAIMHCPESIRSDIDWAKIAIISDPVAYDYIDGTLQDNEEIIECALKSIDMALKRIKEEHHDRLGRRLFGDELKEIHKRLRKKLKEQNKRKRKSKQVFNK